MWEEYRSRELFQLKHRNASQHEAKRFKLRKKGQQLEEEGNKLMAGAKEAVLESAEVSFFFVILRFGAYIYTTF